jgi:Dolichyl-phosphate-mannose-protein mannosyltransferase
MDQQHCAYLRYAEQFVQTALLPGFEVCVIAKKCKANLQTYLGVTESDLRIDFAYATPDQAGPIGMFEPHTNDPNPARPAVSETPPFPGPLWLQYGLLAAMALAVSAVMFGSLHHTFLHVPADNNEGWNAYHALSALSGGVLYPPADALISTNYPPLSFFIVGFAGRLIGDNIIAGRLISIMSLLAVSINVFWLTRLLGGARFFAAFSSLLFLLYVGENGADYIAMNDPQWLGHAFATLGAAFFLVAQERSRPMRYVLLSGLLCVIGVSIKQNLVVLPLALFVWSLFNGRRHLWSWASLSLLIGSILLLLAIMRYGPVLLEDIFLHQRVISVRKFESNVIRFVMPLVPLLVYAAILSAAMWREQRTRFALLYVLIAGALGLFFLSGELCDVNMVFDLIIALCISAGLFGTCVMSVFKSYRQWTAAVALILTSVCLPALGQSMLDSRERVRQDHSLGRAYQDLIGAIAASTGPVACEMTSLCYWAGKSFELDAHNYLQKIKKGKVSPDLLRKLIDDQYFSYLEATAPPARMRASTASMVGDDLSSDVDAHYVIVSQVGEQRLLAPRR